MSNKVRGQLDRPMEARTSAGPSALCVIVIATLVWATLAHTTAHAAAKRIALIVGNSAYERISKLPNPVNDAALMAQTLEALNFEVIQALDQDKQGIERAMKAFGNRLEAAGPDSVGLFFYAGHGVQVDGENFLIPVDAQIKYEADVQFEAVSADLVLRALSYAGSRLNIVILDACRNNPFARSFRSASRGLAKMEGPQGTLIAFSTQPGNVAEDGRGSNSPYAAALARTMTEPGLAIEQVFKRVRRAVIAETQGRQVPWESSSLLGDFVFRPGADTSPPAIAEAPAGDPFELAFWNSIVQSNEAEEYAIYLQKYPSGQFALLARNRLSALEKGRSSPEPDGTSGGRQDERFPDSWPQLWGYAAICTRSPREIAKLTGALERFLDQHRTIEVLEASGQELEPPIARWRIMLADAAKLDLAGQLAAVNLFVNEAAYRPAFSLRERYKTPYEFLVGGGDLEDYTVTKYLSLRELGLPPENMRYLVYRNLAEQVTVIDLVVSFGGKLYLLGAEDLPVETSSFTGLKPIYAMNEERWCRYQTQ